MPRMREPDIEFADPWTKPPRRHRHSEHLVTKLRAEFDLTQEAAAECWGISRALLAKVECGERSLPFTMEEARTRLQRATAGREQFRAAARRLLDELNAAEG